MNVTATDDGSMISHGNIFQKPKQVFCAEAAQRLF
jgi:hypothetical protein